MNVHKKTQAYRPIAWKQPLGYIFCSWQYGSTSFQIPSI